MTSSNLNIPRGRYDAGREISPLIPNSQSLINYLTTLADDTLIMSQRLGEWTGHGPALEQDIAMTNIALDYLGQARMFYQYIAVLKADGSTEDSIAYLRDTHEYRNHLLVELPNGDWAQTLLKIFFYAAWQKNLFEQLKRSDDVHTAAIAEKSLKEVEYHLSWSTDWLIRLGDGTKESNKRLNNAISYLWSFTGELFEEIPGNAVAVNYNDLEQLWLQTINRTFEEATILVPEQKSYQTGGTSGIHTEYLGFILAEMQWIQRVYPGCTW